MATAHREKLTITQPKWRWLTVMEATSSQKDTVDDLHPWHRLVDAYREKRAAEYRFFRAEQLLLSDDVPSQTRVERVRAALRSHEENLLGLSVVRHLSEEERKQCLPELVALASGQHSPFDEARRVILSLPHEWTLAHIERAVEPHLVSGDDEEYSRFLELYSLLDPDLLSGLAQRAMRHPDPEIQAAGRNSTDQEVVNRLRSHYRLDPWAE